MSGRSLILPKGQYLSPLVVDGGEVPLPVIHGLGEAGDLLGLLGSEAGLEGLAHLLVEGGNLLLHDRDLGFEAGLRLLLHIHLLQRALPLPGLGPDFQVHGVQGVGQVLAGVVALFNLSSDLGRLLR